MIGWWLAGFLGLGTPAQSDVPTVIVLTGAEGEEAFGAQFETWSRRTESAARDGGAEVLSIGLDATDGPDPVTDRARVQSALGDLADASTPLWFVYYGHGTDDGRNAKLNLRGPDISADDLAMWLEPIQRPCAVVLCAASTASFLPRLSGEGRVIVTATRSGSESSFSRFGDSFSAALADRRADLDRDEQVSLLEAYLAASSGVEEFYRREARLASEHALLDDNGDGRGTPAAWFRGVRCVVTPRVEDGVLFSVDGLRAHQLHLSPSEAERSIPADVRLQRDALEAEMEALRLRRGVLDEEAYDAALLPIALKLARLYEALSG